MRSVACVLVAALAAGCGSAAGGSQNERCRRYLVDLRAYFGRPQPTRKMLAEADAMLSGLSMPEPVGARGRLVHQERGRL